MNIYLPIMCVFVFSLWSTLSSEAAPRKVGNDFDGDGRTDPAVYYTASGTWLIFQTSTFTVRTEHLGSGACLPAPGDFDGDGKCDLVVFDSTTANWYAKLSSGGEASGPFGKPGDWPVPADYDGDRKTDLGVYDPQTGYWTVFLSKNQIMGSLKWGFLGEFRPWEKAQHYTVLPMPFDYNQDGVDDLCHYYRGQTMALSGWYILYITSGSEYFNWGSPSSLPAPGNFQVQMADAPRGICVYKAKTTEWDIPYRSVFYIGKAGQTLPVSAGDYDGNGYDDNTLYNYETGEWTVIFNTGGAEVAGREQASIILGGSGAIPANIYSTIYILGRYTPSSLL